MSARSHRNRYRTSPSGTDFSEVVKRAKIFFGDGVFGVWKYGDVWSTFRPSVWASDPAGAIYYRYSKKTGAKRGQWERSTTK